MSESCKARSVEIDRQGIVGGYKDVDSQIKFFIAN